MNRIMLVTGGSRGIGAAVAQLAASHGYDVGVNYANDAAAANDVVQHIRDAGRNAIAVRADVSREADVVAMFEKVDAQLGRLDVLVNSAGVIDLAGRLENLTLDRLQRLFSINVFGSFLCAREAVRRMSKLHGGRGGAIVNLSSAAARLGSPNQHVHYASSKGAIDSFTIGLAKEVAAEGIRVNAVRPGIIDTEIHASGGSPDRVREMSAQVPMQRCGTADEVAHSILWLGGPLSGFTTGALLDIAGGR